MGIILSYLAKHDNDVIDLNNEESEAAIFASVIKNITRVNKALQELISNYEHLQKIYKSQEESLQVESSDPEIDEVYKNKDKKKGLKRSKKDSLTTQSDDAYPVTQMIWSENDSKSEEETDKGNSDKDKSNSDKTESVNGNIAIKPPSEPPLKQAEIIFVDARRPTIKKNKPKRPIEPIFSPTYKPPKTRYDKVSESNHSNKNKKKKVKRNKNNSLDITYEPTTSEPYSRSVFKPKSKTGKKLANIWDDVFGNKFIQLQAHSELSVEKMRKHNFDNSSMQEISLRSNNIKSDLDLNDTGIEKVETSQEKHQLDKKMLNSDTDDITREALQANLLREAYGDACLKVVVKKCFKACKAANKEVCRTYKCKQSYKEKFYKSVKKSCITAFHGDTSKEDSKEDSKEASEAVSKETFYYKRTIRDNGNDTLGVQSKISANKAVAFDGLTRNEYLRSCLPHLQMREMSRRSIYIADTSFNATTFPDDTIPNFNVLRDKYERACQKISRKKCQNACKCAYEKVCESFTCNSGRKKAYKKQCRVKCKDVYRNGHSNSKSSQSSSSDSSPDSDDSDDSDDSSDSSS